MLFPTAYGTKDEALLQWRQQRDCTVFVYNGHPIRFNPQFHGGESFSFFLPWVEMDKLNYILSDTECTDRKDRLISMFSYVIGLGSEAYRVISIGVKPATVPTEPWEIDISFSPPWWYATSSYEHPR